MITRIASTHYTRKLHSLHLFALLSRSVTTWRLGNGNRLKLRGCACSRSRIAHQPYSPLEDVKEKQYRKLLSSGKIEFACDVARQVGPA